MARRRYQKGNLRKRGKRNPVWELQWWTDCISLDGTLGRRRESTILGYVSDLTRRQARKRAEEHLRPLNLGKVTPLSNLPLREFVERHFVPNVFPTLKLSTQGRYRRVKLDFNHLQPFGSLAFPFSEMRKTAVKQPIFVDELLTSSRNVSSGKLCRIGLR